MGRARHSRRSSRDSGSGQSNQLADGRFRQSGAAGAAKEGILAEIAQCNEEWQLPVESRCFAIGVSSVILMNTLIIGCECQDMQNKYRQHIYERLELMFVVIYLAELSARLGHYGCRTFFFPRDSMERDWNWFDFMATAAGVFGLIAKAWTHLQLDASVLRLLRVLRVLRVFRVFRLFRFLKDIEYTLMSAATSMFRVVIMVALLEFIFGVMVTNFLSSSDDEMISEMFHRLSSSMFTLFHVMVGGVGAAKIDEASRAPGHMMIITDFVDDMYPYMWIYWIIFVFLGNISIMAVIPSLFVTLSLRDTEAAKKRKEAFEWQRRVDRHQKALEMVFAAADVDCSNSVSRDEIEAVFKSPTIMRQLNFQDQEEEEEDEDCAVHHLDVRQLALEFSFVFDAIEEEGRNELSCSEFISTFREMRRKPQDTLVLSLQQEIVKLRALVMVEHDRLMEEIQEMVLLEGTETTEATDVDTDEEETLEVFDRQPQPLANKHKTPDLIYSILSRYCCRL